MFHVKQEKQPEVRTTSGCFLLVLKRFFTENSGFLQKMTTLK